MLEDFIIKYFWGAAGLVLCAVPVFTNVGAQVVKAVGHTEGTAFDEISGTPL